MRLTFAAVTLLILSVCSPGLPAQQQPTLAGAIRDQYVESVDEEEISEITKTDSLARLDQYSHFLTAKELTDVSNDPGAAAFILPIAEQVWYIRIPVFHAKTSWQIHQASEVAMQQSGADYIIVDLRGNRGGLLNAAVEVADEFVAAGVLATTAGRLDTANLVFLAKPNGLLEGRRIAVLIDKNTASAAELLAGILKLDANACILGQRSYGKSAVQTQIRLNSGGALSLTTAAYFFSDGKTVDEQGITPDIAISNWQFWRNPPYLMDQNLSAIRQRNPLIEKSMRCMGAQ